MPDIDLAGAIYPDVPAVDLPKSGGGTARFYDPTEILYAGSATSGGSASKTEGIPYGEVDSTSTSTVFTATVSGITELKNGTCVFLRNGVVTSASGFTININGLGAKPVYSNMATGNGITPTAPTRETTLFNVNYTLFLVYSEELVSGGAWINYRGYYSDANTIGYQVRTNSTVLKTADQSRYYRIFFTSADGTHFVPANTGKDNSATSAKTVNQRPINPFGKIIYYSSTTNLSAESDLGAAYCWEQYAFSLGYSFNTSGAALTLTTKTPVYIKAAPQSDGSAIIDSTTPYVQALPSTEDGKIYIFLGVAYSATNIELTLNHPVYEYKSGAIRLWTNATSGGGGGGPSPSSAIPQPLGIADAGTSADYSRADHVHEKPTYSASDVGAIEAPASANSGDVLTYDGTSWGSAAVPSELPSVSSTDDGKVLRVSSGAWAVELDGMYIASYGKSTYAEVLAAYKANKVVYCRASSGSNPASGSQTRMAFMAYINNETTPTEFEFQYYRSVNTHSESQQGDQMYVYKINSSGTWSVTVRESYTKIVAGTGLTSSYSNGVLTISLA